MGERSDVEVLAAKINAMNASQLDLRLALTPGAPDSLEEAVDRVLRGEPVVREAEDAADERP